MNKPVLPLVDDDRAVLDALEVELAPEFAQLCRIQVFDDPRAVLEVVRQWAAEHRSIVVAVVDQKLPGMSGVELLTALHRSAAQAVPEIFARARFLQAIRVEAR